MSSHTEFDTLVRNPAGVAERRRVLAVREWRIEDGLQGNGLVLSVIGGDGCAQSFLVGWEDASDISEVLRLRARR